MIAFEKTQPGNPHGLTVDQHIFPKASIKRFANSAGGVQARRRETQGKFGPAFSIGPEHAMFCAKRAWDQRAEKIHSRSIERDFAALADKIVSGEIRSLDATANELVSLFHDLVASRLDLSLNREPDAKFKDVSPNHDLDLNKQEELESLGVMFVRPDGKMSGRTMAGLKMMARTMHLQRAANYPKWGICRAVGGELLVPDNFSIARIVPVSPTILLTATSSDVNLHFETVAELNALHLSRAYAYCFARDFSVCPVMRPSIPCRRLMVV